MTLGRKSFAAGIALAVIAIIAIAFYVRLQRTPEVEVAQLAAGFNVLYLGTTSGTNHVMQYPSGFQEKMDRVRRLLRLQTRPGSTTRTTRTEPEDMIWLQLTSSTPLDLSRIHVYAFSKYGEESSMGFSRSPNNILGAGEPYVLSITKSRKGLTPKVRAEVRLRNTNDQSDTVLAQLKIHR